MHLCDAHNHLHFPALAGDLDAVDAAVAAMRRAGITRCVVNGTHEGDWPAVAALARRFPELVLPAFGLHPWHIAARSPDWLATLAGFLDEFPTASIGECGLDMSPARAHPDQSGVFAAQLELAARRGIPITVHCVRAWQPLSAAIQQSTPPTIVLHDFSGTPELVDQLIRHAGVFFSFSPRTLDPARAKLHHAFQHAPAARILLETDAPNIPLPQPPGDPATPAAPADLAELAARLAPLRGLTGEALARLTAANFQQCFINRG